MRKKNTEEEVAAAKKEQAEKGQLSVFESLPAAVTEESTSTTVARKKYTEVCCFIALC